MDIICTKQIGNMNSIGYVTQVTLLRYPPNFARWEVLIRHLYRESGELEKRTTWKWNIELNGWICPLPFFSLKLWIVAFHVLKHSLDPILVVKTIATMYRWRFTKRKFLKYIKIS